MIDSLIENGFWFHIGRFLIGSSVLLLTVWALELLQVIKDFDVRSYFWKAALLGSLLLLLPVSLPQAPTFYLQSVSYPVTRPSTEMIPSSVFSEAPDSISSMRAPQSTETSAFNNDKEISSNERLVKSTGQGQAIGLTSNPSSSLADPFSKVLDSLTANTVSYWLIVIWGLGASLALTRLYLGYRSSMLRLGKRQLFNDSDPILKMFHELCEEAGISKKPRLTRSDKFVSPVTLLGNEICLPGWVDHSVPENELRSLLAHELGHVRHHDLTVLLGLQLLTCLFFFQPLFILARNRLVDLSEFLADQAALAHCENSNAITTALVNCASRINSEKPFKWGFAMIGNTSRLKLRILQLQNAGRLTTGRFNKAGRVTVLTAICVVVLLTPTMQNQTIADVVVSPERIEMDNVTGVEQETLGSSFETFHVVNAPETDIASTPQGLELLPVFSELDVKKELVILESNLQSLRQTVVQADEKNENQRLQWLENNQVLLAQNQPHQVQEHQNLQELQLQELNLQQQFFTEENQSATYLLLNYSEIGPFDVSEIVLTESESKKEIKIHNIQSIKRGAKNYLLTDIKPGNYYVSGFYAWLGGGLGGRIDIDDNDALIEVVENSINYIGDIRFDSRGIPGGTTTVSSINGSGRLQFEFSPKAATLLARRER